MPTTHTPNLDRIMTARHIIPTPEILALITEEFINRTTEANERLQRPLIAAAPDLHSASAALLAFCEANHLDLRIPEMAMHIGMLNAAVAKAEGR